eukprot:765719-Hanusia_phi.AAC.2
MPGIKQPQHGIRTRPTKTSYLILLPHCENQGLQASPEELSRMFQLRTAVEIGRLEQEIDQKVSKEDHEKLKRDHEALKRTVDKILMQLDANTRARLYAADTFRRETVDADESPCGPAASDELNCASAWNGSSERQYNCPRRRIKSTGVIRLHKTPQKRHVSLEDDELGAQQKFKRGNNDSDADSTEDDPLDADWKPPIFSTVDMYMFSNLSFLSNSC